MKNLYNTKQKQIILYFLESNKHKCFEVKEIAKYLEENNNIVGTTTIYRYLEELINQNKVKKIKDNTISAKFGYFDCHEEHFHLKCESCGKIIHLDCETTKEMIKHIHLKHHFKINEESFLINGKCENC